MKTPVTSYATDGIKVPIVSYVIDGIKVSALHNNEFSKEEASAYLRYAEANAKSGLTIQEVTLDFEQDNPTEVSIQTAYENVPRFERIRRITGYLVGTLDRWNDGKQSEEADRRGHSLEGMH